MESDAVNRRERPSILVTVPSSLGWMALITIGDVLKQLTFGHASAAAAVRALDPGLLENAESVTLNDDQGRGARGQGPGGTGQNLQSAIINHQSSIRNRLVGRLQAYASGVPVDFRDVMLDLGRLSEFRRRVVHHCRQIPYGKTLTYGQLAAKAGSPQAARTVGRLMAANRAPLIVPCHRVVSAGGRLGGFSAPGGTQMKQRLLALEAGPRHQTQVSSAGVRDQGPGVRGQGPRRKTCNLQSSICNMQSLSSP